MKIDKFENIIAWQKSKDLALNIYDAFRSNNDYSFRDQIKRAAVSIMNNIAEGFERGSKKELKRFLYISKASCGEVRSMLYLAFDLNYISQETFRKLHNHATEISKILSGFIKTL